MTTLSGARALVTGANGGLGRAISQALKDQGCEVVVTGRRAEPLQAVADEVGARAIVADLSVRGDLHRILDEAGQLDILVANAALPGSGLLQDWEEDQIDRIMEVNLTDPIVMTQALLPGFQARGMGHFVYVSSLAGKVATRGAPMYSATKFGLRGFAGSLRCDLHGTGIGCSVISPGFVRDAGMSARKVSPALSSRASGAIKPRSSSHHSAFALVRSSEASSRDSPLRSRPGSITVFLSK